MKRVMALVLTLAMLGTCLFGCGQKFFLKGLTVGAVKG